MQASTVMAGFVLGLFVVMLSISILISHALRNPLNTVVWMLRSILVYTPFKSVIIEVDGDARRIALEDIVAAIDNRDVSSFPPIKLVPVPKGEPCWVCGQVGCTDIRAEHGPTKPPEAS